MLHELLIFECHEKGSKFKKIYRSSLISLNM